MLTILNLFLRVVTPLLERISVQYLLLKTGASAEIKTVVSKIKLAVKNALAKSKGQDQ